MSYRSQSFGGDYEMERKKRKKKTKTRKRKRYGCMHTGKLNANRKMPKLN